MRTRQNCYATAQNYSYEPELIEYIAELSDLSDHIMAGRDITECSEEEQLTLRKIAEELDTLFHREES